MARGDAWRISGGIYIPNSRFQIDSDYDWAATENIPDGWTKSGSDGTMQISLADGFSDSRSMRIFYSAVNGSNVVLSGKSPAGSVPKRKGSNLYVRFRVVFWYKKENTSGTQTLTPWLVFYNSDESSSTMINFADITTAQSGWFKYEDTRLIDTTILGPSGIDHLRFRLGYNVATSNATIHIDDVTVSYQLTDLEGANGYDSLTSRPLPSGLSLFPIQLGRLDRTHLGQMRRVDTTGGTRVRRLIAQFETLRDADAKVWSYASDLCTGNYNIDTDALGTASAVLAAGPVVIEPFIGDGATQAAGKLPENFYAWITQPPEFEPLGYLGNVWRGSVAMEEVG